MNKKKFLEVRELYPDGRSSENVQVYVVPVAKETDATFVTDHYHVHNIVGCTPTSLRKKKVVWWKDNGLRAGDIPCEFTPTFKIVRVHSGFPIIRNKHAVFLGGADGV